MFSLGNILYGDQNNCLEEKNAHLGSAAGGGGTPDPENLLIVRVKFCPASSQHEHADEGRLQVVLVTHQRSAG